MKRTLMSVWLVLACTMPGYAQESKPDAGGELNRWSKEKANAWYAKQPWRVGCNFIPSTAINQLEMWQADTFDSATIERELKWASELGFNTVRVYLHDLAWEADATGFKQRMDQFLGTADKHGIKPILVLFDDCWNANPKIGKQPQPQPGVHNSGWLQSPGCELVNKPESWPRLEKYLKDIVGTFSKDTRILLWDLYNEPGNSGQGNKSLPLLKKTFQWAREINPTQPLSAGVWTGLKDLNDFQLAASDIITFHNYEGADNLAGQIASLKKQGRPVICTEWMRRGISEVASCLPIFNNEKVGCLNWGLVAGKTQTIYPWGSPPGAPEPKIWFHDLLRKDGTPFSAQEATLFSKLTNKGTEK
ncbi:MAG: cellulase family glycosylhydrolase [Verrucomicrobiota bacterium]